MFNRSLSAIVLNKLNVFVCTFALTVDCHVMTVLEGFSTKFLNLTYNRKGHKAVFLFTQGSKTANRKM